MGNDPDICMAEMAGIGIEAVVTKPMADDVASEGVDDRPAPVKKANKNKSSATQKTK